MSTSPKKLTAHLRVTKMTSDYNSLDTDDHQPQLMVYQHGSDLQDDFSDRERHILEHMAMGKTAFEIGDALCLSHHTVKTHQKNMLKRTECNNSTHLIACCIRLGIID